MKNSAFQKGENHFSWWMPTYVTFLLMGTSILVLFNINETIVLSMLKDDGLIQILTAAILIAACIFYAGSLCGYTSATTCLKSLLQR